MVNRLDHLQWRGPRDLFDLSFHTPHGLSTLRCWNKVQEYQLRLFQMRRVTASTRRRDARSVGQSTLGRYCQHQANLIPRPKLDKYSLADPVVLKQSTNAQALISCTDYCPQRNHGQRIGIPLSNGEQTAHPTDIVMWIDTDVIENSLTKDDASNYNSSYIYIYGFEHMEHSRNPIQNY